MYKKPAILILVLVLSLALAATAYAQSGQIDSVVVNVENTWVEVDLMDYAIAYSMGAGDQMHDYLKGNGTFLNVVAIKSGQKYIGLAEYATEFANSGGSTDTAIKNADPLAENLVNGIFKFVDFDNQGNPILEPVTSDGGDTGSFEVVDIY